jgi:hypothetical protein
VRRLVLAIVLTTCACGGGSTPAATPSAPITVVSLAIGGNTTFTDRGQASQLAATATLSNGLKQDQTSATTWSSSNAAVVTVSSLGLATAVGAGSAQINASFQGLSASATANVTVACQANDTANVAFGNRSTSTTQDVVWDGFAVGTLIPGQTSTPPLTVAAGVPHTLIFRIANTSTIACAYLTVVPAQCSTPVYTCPISP